MAEINRGLLRLYPESDIMIKRLFLLLLMFHSVMWIERAFGQRIKAEVIAGMNLSQVDGDLAYGFYKAGINAGLGAIVPIGKNFSFSLETLYNQKGAYQGPFYADTNSLGNLLTGMYKLNIDYLEVPVMVQYTDKDIIGAGLGVSYGRMVRVKEYEHDTLNRFTTLNSGVYNHDDFNVIFDVRFRIHKKLPRLKFNARYAYSIAKIRTRDFYTKSGVYDVTREQYNNLISLRLIYVLNEKAPLSTKK